MLDPQHRPPSCGDRSYFLPLISAMAAAVVADVATRVLVSAKIDHHATFFGLRAALVVLPIARIRPPAWSEVRRPALLLGSSACSARRVKLERSETARLRSSSGDRGGGVVIIIVSADTAFAMMVLVARNGHVAEEGVFSIAIFLFFQCLKHSCSITLDAS